ncbi:O-methyltransferase [Actinoalloteichus spitiensis]|uniref:O-methyltransferase n=1 Tax=Actinoalloteichus spitiensis TaxID=252394 RepID=UPI0003624637|nr:O-methyltransferase [Actinoalloteichus spitiensis]
MPSQDRWAEVDDYLTGLLVPEDPVLDHVLSASAAAGLPPINVAPNQGKLLHLLAVITRAHTILEVGTLGGYSTVWLGRALPEHGRLVTLEGDPRHAEVARSNLEAAGLLGKVDIHIGPAQQTMAQLVTAGMGPFDLIFLDADKQGYPAYLDYSLSLSRPGTVLIADNVVRGGRVADPDSGDGAVEGVRSFLELVADEPRLSATAVQTVGAKGYDGFTLAVVGS